MFNCLIMVIKIHITKVPQHTNFLYLEENYLVSCGTLGSFKSFFAIPESFGYSILGSYLFLFKPLLEVPHYYSYKSITSDNVTRTLHIKRFFLSRVKRHFTFIQSRVQTLIASSVEGFKKELRVLGVGYRFFVHLNLSVLKLGYSHLLFFLVPLTIQVRKRGKSVLELFSIQLHSLSETSIHMRGFKLPNVYTGRGIRFRKEKLQLKQGKSSQV